MGRLVALVVGVIALSACTPQVSIDLIFHPDGPDVVARAHRIAECESRHTADAVSPGGGNHGTMQIANVHAEQFEAVTGQPWETGRYDAWWNVYYAHWLYLQQGFTPWSCRGA